MEFCDICVVTDNNSSLFVGGEKTVSQLNIEIGDILLFVKVSPNWYEEFVFIHAKSSREVTIRIEGFEVLGEKEIEKKITSGRV